MKNVLFICVENACRSQMAEAFGNIYGQGIIVSFSSGSKPSGQVNPKAIKAMKELGYDMENHSSKSLDEIPQTTYDYVITMGCGDECPYIKTKKRINWQVSDPKDLEATEFNLIRDQIKDNVLSLIKGIKALSD